MCVRSQHLTLSGESTDYYAFPFALGNLVPDWTNYYEGISLDLILFGATKGIFQKYNLHRPSLYGVRVRSLARVEEQRSVGHLPPLGRTRGGKRRSPR